MNPEFVFANNGYPLFHRLVMFFNESISVMDSIIDFEQSLSVCEM